MKKLILLSALFISFGAAAQTSNSSTAETSKDHIIIADKFRDNVCMKGQKQIDKQAIEPKAKKIRRRYLKHRFRFRGPRFC